MESHGILKASISTNPLSRLYSVSTCLSLLLRYNCAVCYTCTDCLGTTIWFIAVNISSRAVVFAGLNFISTISLGLLDSSST